MIAHAPTDAPSAVRWTVIDDKGATVGTVSQSNPNGTLESSTSVIASAAAPSVVRLLPSQ